MVATYTIMGRVVPSHHIALATLGLTSLLAIPNPFKSKPAPTVKIDASSPEEEAFIKKYLSEHEPKAAKQTAQQ